MISKGSSAEDEKETQCVCKWEGGRWKRRGGGHSWILHEGINAGEQRLMSLTGEPRFEIHKVTFWLLCPGLTNQGC